MITETDFTDRLRAWKIKGKRLRDLNKILCSEPKLVRLVFDGKLSTLQFLDGSTFASTYEFSQLLGAGSFGLVFAAKDKRNDELCAVKVLSKSRMVPEDVVRIQSEMEVLRRIKHENIIKLFGVKEAKHFVFIFMEYLPGGTLSEWIAYMHRGKFPSSTIEENARKIVKSILQGIKTIHEHGYLHRDLKPDNILFAVPGDTSTLKIADFGLCAKYDYYDLAHSEICGTVTYMAPEQLLHLPYYKSVDMWACGTIMYKLLSGRHPLYKKGMTKEEYTKAIQSPIWCFTDKISRQAKDLFMKMCRKDPLARYSASEALEHSWITGKQENVGLAEVMKAVFFAAACETDMKELRKKKLQLELGVLLNSTKEEGIGTECANVVLKSDSSSPRKFTRFCFRPNLILSTQENNKPGAIRQRNVIRLRRMIANKLSTKPVKKGSSTDIARLSNGTLELKPIHSHAGSIKQMPLSSRSRNIMGSFASQIRHTVENPYGFSPAESPLRLHFLRNRLPKQHTLGRNNQLTETQTCDFATGLKGSFNGPFVKRHTGDYDEVKDLANRAVHKKMTVIEPKTKTVVPHIKLRRIGDK